MQHSEGEPFRNIILAQKNNTCPDTLTVLLQQAFLKEKIPTILGHSIWKNVPHSIDSLQYAAQAGFDALLQISCKNDTLIVLEVQRLADRKTALSISAAVEKANIKNYYSLAKEIVRVLQDTQLLQQ